MPPVRARPVYAEYKNRWHNLDSLWGLFEIAKLTEIMRQQRDNNFINLLNRVRAADLDDDDVLFMIMIMVEVNICFTN